jgi:hypothetical protein
MNLKKILLNESGYGYDATGKPWADPSCYDKNGVYNLSLCKYTKNTYTVRSEVISFENATNKNLPELTIYKNTVFTKDGDKPTLTAKTNYNFKSTHFGYVTTGSDNQGRAKSVKSSTFKGIVEYNCKTGKFKAPDKSKYEYFAEDSPAPELVRELNKVCKFKPEEKKTGGNTNKPEEKKTQQVVNQGPTTSDLIKKTQELLGMQPTGQYTEDQVLTIFNNLGGQTPTFPPGLTEELTKIKSVMKFLLKEQPTAQPSQTQNAIVGPDPGPVQPNELKLQQTQQGGLQGGEVLDKIVTNKEKSPALTNLQNLLTGNYNKPLDPDGLIGPKTAKAIYDVISTNM